MKNLCALTLSLVLFSSLPWSQQLATNAPGHGLLANTVTPIPGANVVLNTALGPQTLRCDLYGGANAGFLLGTGSLAPVSIALGLGAGNEIDIDLSLPAEILFSYLDVFAPLNFIAPPFIDATTGGFTLTASMSPLYAGLTVALQAIIQDPSLPVGLGATATGAWNITSNFSVVVIADDQVSATVPLPGNPITIYGQSYSNLEFSTNGWIKMGGNSSGSDPSVSVADFITGLVGGGSPAPVLCPLWDDLDFANTAAQSVVLTSPATNIYQITYNAVDYAPASPIGTLVVTINANNPASMITYDYTNCMPSIANANSSLIGITSGNSTIVPTVVNEVNIVSGGSVNTFTPASSAPQTIFQNFGPFGAFSELEDTDGLVLTFQDFDPLGGGNFIVF